MDPFIEKNIYYLNIRELRRLAWEYCIPYEIYIEKKKGVHINTHKTERKIHIIKRLLKYFRTGRSSEETFYQLSVINNKPLEKVTAKSKVYYGQFNSTNKQILSLLGQLTNYEFKHGAQSFILIERFWRKGIAPSYKEYAEAWMKMKAEPHPEWKYLEDMKKIKDMTNWKVYRKNMARTVIKRITEKYGQYAY